MTKKKVAIWLVLLFVIATAVKSFVFNFRIRKPNDPPFSPLARSAGESRKHGIWICDAKIELKPAKSATRGIRIIEAWIEASWEEEFYLVWFKKRTRMDWNWFCFNVPRNADGYYEFAPDLACGAGEVFHYYVKIPLNDFEPREYRVGYKRFDAKDAEELGQVILTPLK